MAKKFEKKAVTGMKFIEERTITKQGTSKGINLPHYILKMLGAGVGDKVDLYYNDNGQFLIDVKKGV